MHDHETREKWEKKTLHKTGSSAVGYISPWEEKTGKKDNWSHNLQSSQTSQEWFFFSYLYLMALMKEIES